METTASRQSAWSSLNEALDTLAEINGSVLSTAVGLERRLVVEQTVTDAQPDSDMAQPVQPLIADTENRVRNNIRQARETLNILQNIEREIS